VGLEGHACAALGGRLEVEREAVVVEHAPGARRVAATRMRVMGALEGGDVGIVVTEHVLRAREQLEVVRIQLDLRVRGGKPLAGIEPRALGVRLAAALQVGDGRRHALDYRQP
jgi:hypothetical protein